MYAMRGRMTRGHKMSRREYPASLRRSSWSRFASVWRGKDRPVTPWIINTDSSPRPLRRKRKEPRALRRRPDR